MSAAPNFMQGTGAVTGDATPATPAPKPRKPRGPSAKMRRALHEEYMRGLREGEAATEGAGIIVSIMCAACALVGFGLGAVIF